MWTTIIVSYLLAVCALATLIAWAAQRGLRRRLRRAVFRALYGAAENGHFAPGEYLHGVTADEIAYDLKAYDAPGCENAHWSELLPYVEEWFAKGNRV